MTGVGRSPHEVSRQRSGHYCWRCQRMRPNEKFSGTGHARHVCRDCRRISRAGGCARVAPNGTQAPSEEDPS